jgi:uncharacterized Rossmann fold enzyme
MSEAAAEEIKLPERPATAAAALEQMRNGSNFVLPGVPRGKVNTDDKTLLSHIETNIRRQLPQVQRFRDQDRPCIIACGGPSLKDEIETVRKMRDDGAALIACNGTANYLVSQGIIPSAVVIMDARPFNVDFVREPISGCRYLLASQAHPDIFDMCEGRDTWIFHPDINIDGKQIEREVLDGYYCGRHFTIEGGSTVGLRSFMLARYLGFADLHVFGFDGCYREKEHHAYPQSFNDREKTQEITICKRKFIMSGWMIKQYEDFINLIRWRGNLFRLQIYGDGLFAHVTTIMTSPRMRVKLFVSKWMGRIAPKLARKVFRVPQRQEGDNGSSSMDLI